MDPIEEGATSDTDPEVEANDFETMSPSSNSGCTSHTYLVHSYSSSIQSPDEDSDEMLANSYDSRRSSSFETAESPKKTVFFVDDFSLPPIWMPPPMPLKMGQKYHRSELRVLKDCLSPDPPTASDIHGFSCKIELLIQLTDRTGYTLVQKNGQRIYGGPPPNWTGPPPCKGSEIFVGRIPRDVYEYDLVPIFEKIGQIYELRLMMDFSQSNRGYMFVRYTNPSDAQRAVRTLDNYEIKPKKFIGVVVSVDNRKLWINGIPKNKSADEIKEEMEKLTGDVRCVKIFPPKMNKQNRGYFYVEFNNHRSAALARRKLVPGRVFLFDMEIQRVDWAEPEMEVDVDVMAKVTILFVRYVPSTMTEFMLFELFSTLSNGNVDRVKKIQDFAFVHFADRKSAEKALSASNGLVVEGTKLEVEWSKPVNKVVKETKRQMCKLGMPHPPRSPSYSYMPPAHSSAPATPGAVPTLPMFAGYSSSPPWSTPCTPTYHGNSNALFNFGGKNQFHFNTNGDFPDWLPLRSPQINMQSMAGHGLGPYLTGPASSGIGGPYSGGQPYM